MTYALTDIHQHLLWAMDDGAASPEITRRMMKDAARQLELEFSDSEKVVELDGGLKDENSMRNIMC
mgnify:CR=1 FL=1